MAIVESDQRISDVLKKVIHRSVVVVVAAAAAIHRSVVVEVAAAAAVVGW